MSDHTVLIGLKVADPSIAWPIAEEHLAERTGWALRQITISTRQGDIIAEAMCAGDFSVHRMHNDPGFAIAATSNGLRVSSGGRVFARCKDAMAMASA